MQKDDGQCRQCGEDLPTEMFLAANGQQVKACLVCRERERVRDRERRAARRAKAPPKTRTAAQRKLTANQAGLIRFLAYRVTAAEASRTFKVAEKTIATIWNQQAWRHVAAIDQAETAEDQARFSRLLAMARAEPRKVITGPVPPRQRGPKTEWVTRKIRTAAEVEALCPSARMSDHEYLLLPRQDNPDVRLVSGILFHALNEYCYDIKNTGTVDAAWHMESAQWLRSESEETLSAKWICSILGFDHKRLIWRMKNRWREWFSAKGRPIVKYHRNDTDDDVELLSAVDYTVAECDEELAA